MPITARLEHQHCCYEYICREQITGINKRFCIQALDIPWMSIRLTFRLLKGRGTQINVRMWSIRGCCSPKNVLVGMLAACHRPHKNVHKSNSFSRLSSDQCNVLNVHICNWVWVFFEHIMNYGMLFSNISQDSQWTFENLERQLLCHKCDYTIMKWRRMHSSSIEKELGITLSLMDVIAQCTSFIFERAYLPRNCFNHKIVAYMIFLVTIVLSRYSKRLFQHFESWIGKEEYVNHLSWMNHHRNAIINSRLNENVARFARGYWTPFDVWQ